MAKRFRIGIIGFIFGITIAQLFPSQSLQLPVLLTIAVVVGVYAIGFPRHRSMVIMVMAIMLGLLMGRGNGSPVVAPPQALTVIAGNVASVRATTGSYRVATVIADDSNTIAGLPSSVTVITMVRPLDIGSRVRITCRWKLDVSGWSCFSRDIKFLNTNDSVVWWRRWGWMMRSGIVRILSQAVPEPESSVVQAIVFGFDEGLSPAVKERFKITGMTHLLVASGMQVVLTIQMFQAVLLLLGIARRFRLPLLVCSVLVLLLIVGFSPSSVRGAIMGLIPTLSLALGRGRTNAVHSLIVAAGAMVVVDPTVVSSLSFQLSFLATAGIIVLSPWIESLWENRAIPEWVSAPAAATIGATLATLPVLATQFGVPSVGIIIPNIILGFMVELMTTLTTVVVGLGVISVGAANMLGVFLTVLVWIALGFVEFFAHGLEILSHAPLVSEIINGVVVVGAILFVIRHYGVFQWWNSSRAISA